MATIVDHIVKKKDSHDTDISIEEVTFTEAQEKALIRRLDLRLIPYLCLIYMFSFLDRVNIGFARLYGLEADLKLTPSEYSWTLSIFFIGYVLFEIPSNLMMKRISPQIWMCRIMITWGVITMALAACHTFAALLATRFFLGVAEAGLFPGIIFYLSFWYTRREQGIKIAFFYSAASLAGAFGGLISYGISFIDGAAGLKGWQWIFILEGAPTIILGFTTYFIMPGNPKDSKWLTPREKAFLNQRLIADHVEVECKVFDKAQFIDALTDFKVYLHMLLCIGFVCPLFSLALLLPTIINDLGFTKIQSMLLTVPPYIIALFVAVGSGYNSDRIMERGYHIIVAALAAIAGFITLISTESIGGRYAAVIIAVVGTVNCVPPSFGWSNNNMKGSTKAATSSAMIIGFGNIGGIISGQFYRASEAPLYIPSHSTNIAFLVLTVVTTALLKWCYKRENRKLDMKEGLNDSLGDASDIDLSAPKKFRYVL